MRLRAATNTICVVMFCAAASTSEAEVLLRSAWVSALGGYDSNIRRVSEANPPPGISVEGDPRAVIGAGAEGHLRAGRFFGSVRVEPYYIKYAGSSEFDRGEVYVATPVGFSLGRGWSFESSNTLRYTDFPQRPIWNRTYNNTQVGLYHQSSARWSASSNYRHLYRDHPSPNLASVNVDGFGGTAAFHATNRFSMAATGRYDVESIDFVFPGGTDGRRATGELSTRYQMTNSIIIMGKYLYQDDETDVLFDAGRDLDKLGQGSESASDDVLQSIRFLEDRDFNYRKHLAVALVIGRISERQLIEGFVLYQNKRLKERILSVLGAPSRTDNTWVAQASYSVRTTTHLSLICYGRLEHVDSNDPDHRYDLFTSAIGLRWHFARPE